MWVPLSGGLFRKCVNEFEFSIVKSSWMWRPLATAATALCYGAAVRPAAGARKDVDSQASPQPRLRPRAPYPRPPASPRQ